jgi:hypothetical protein
MNKTSPTPSGPCVGSYVHAWVRVAEGQCQSRKASGRPTRGGHQIGGKGGFGNQIFPPLDTEKKHSPRRIYSQWRHGLGLREGERNLKLHKNATEQER